MNIVDLTLQDYVVFILCLLRMGGIVVFAPFFGGEDFPRLVRIGFAVFLSILAFPYASATLDASLPLSTGVLLGLAAREIFVGLVFGFATSLVFAGIQLGGELVGQQIGFSLANIIDPMLEEEVGMISFFKFMLAVVVFLSLNLHLVILQFLVGSYAVVGLGGAVLRVEMLEHVLGMFGQIWTAAVQVGGPVILVILLVSVVEGMLSRTMPQLNIVVIGLPLRTLVGLLALSLAARPIVRSMAWLCRQMVGDVEYLVGYLAPLPA
ncbi:MAG: flagellar biosynthetic protein FliR [Planctomycetota bacterium]